MIRLPKKRPTNMGRGMTMLQFADYVCSKAQVQTTINKALEGHRDPQAQQPKGAAK